MAIAQPIGTAAADGAAGAGYSSREFVSDVVAIDPIMGDAALMTVTAPTSVVEPLRAGRFVQITCRYDHAFDPLLRRPYSVYRVNRAGGTMQLLVRPFGRGSAWLSRRQIGDRLAMLGPLGTSYALQPGSRNVLLVSGGVGVAPMVMLADEAVGRGLNVAFLMGALDATGLLPADELHRSVEYVTATDDGSQGHRGFVTELVADYVRWADQIFACGPEPMYRSLREVVAPLRFDARPSVQVSIERDMACGVGVCLGCVVPTKRGMETSCVTGPIFDLDDILW